jgi:methylglutaconyl-CoA hydratase
VHEVCEPQALDACVAQIMDTLVANGPAAVKACKQLVRDVAGQPVTETLRAETARRIADLRASPEGREGVQAFLNKRSPNWLV